MVLYINRENNVIVYHLYKYLMDNVHQHVYEYNKWRIIQEVKNRFNIVDRKPDKNNSLEYISFCLNTSTPPLDIILYDHAITIKITFQNRGTNINFIWGPDKNSPNLRVYFNISMQEQTYLIPELLTSFNNKYHRYHFNSFSDVYDTTLDAICKELISYQSLRF